MECLRAELECKIICTNCSNYMKKPTYVRLICSNQQCKHNLRGEIQPGNTSAGKDPKGGWGGCGGYQTKHKTTISYFCEKKNNPCFIWVCVDWGVLCKMYLVNLLHPIGLCNWAGCHTPSSAQHFQRDVASWSEAGGTFHKGVRVTWQWSSNIWSGAVTQRDKLAFVAMGDVLGSSELLCKWGLDNRTVFWSGLNGWCGTSNMGDC